MSARTIPGPIEARERLRELAEARGGYEPLSGLAVSHLAEAAIARAEGRPDREAEELQVACALQELRARRVAMGRDPDDERTAVADLPELSGAEGCTTWQAGWCAVHGDCTCPGWGAENEDELGWEPSDDCPLHGHSSSHGDVVDPRYRDLDGEGEQITTSVYKTTPPDSDGPFREDADERLAALEEGGRPFSLLDVARAAVGPDEAAIVTAPEGVYYHDGEYPEDGSVGPFASTDEAAEHARLGGYRLSPIASADPPPVNVGVRLGPTPETVLVMAELLEHHRETLRELTTCDGIGDVEEMLHKREPWLFEGDGRARNLEGDDPGPIAEGLELVEVAPGVEVLREKGS